MNYSPPGSSVHGILQARILEWVASSFCSGASWPRDRTVGLLHLQMNSLSWASMLRKNFHTHFHSLFWTYNLCWSPHMATICWWELRSHYRMNTKRMGVNNKLLTCKIGTFSNVWKPTFITRIIAKIHLGNIDTHTHAHTDTQTNIPYILRHTYRLSLEIHNCT